MTESDMAETTAEFIGTSEGVQRYGRMIMYSLIHFDFGCQIVLSVVYLGGI